MKVPFYRHQLTADDATAIAAVLSTPILTSGQVGRDVEAQIASLFGVKDALLVNSWTNGAVACLLAMDVEPGDEVIIPAMTFIATANVIELLGAKPVFVDVDPLTLMMTPEAVRAAMTARTKAVIPVHLYGQMMDVAALREAIGHRIKIIEDCAHSFESTLRGDRPGTHSDAAIFSFYATKNVTCGEGGAIITRDPDLAHQLRVTRLHGMSAGAIDRYRAGTYTHWDMPRLGVKANLPDLLSALLPAQLKQLESKLEQRALIAQRYQQAFESEPEISTQVRIPGAKHAWHLYTICVPPDLRDPLMLALNAAGIGCAVNFRSVPTMTYYRESYGYTAAHFPISETWGSGVISLPLFPGLTAQEQSYVIDVVKRELASLARRAA